MAYAYYKMHLTGSLYRVGEDTVELYIRHSRKYIPVGDVLSKHRIETMGKRYRKKLTKKEVFLELL